MMATLSHRNRIILTIAISLAVVTIVTVSMLKKKPKSDCKKVPSRTNSEFYKAANQIRTTHISLNIGEKLMLYALYKQATEGDAGDAPSSLFVEPHVKHDAWSKLRGMSCKEAAQQYIELANEIAKRGPQECEEEENDVGSMNGFAPAVSRPTEENDTVPCDGSPESLLLSAASQSNVDLLEDVLRNHDVNVDYRDESGQTALHLAADKGSLKCVQVLLHHRADVSSSDHDGISVLMAAVIAGNVEICKLLLENGADPLQSDTDGDTPLSCVLDDGSLELRELFARASF